MKTLYEKCTELNIPTDSHESDLYIPVNDVTKSLIGEYEYKSNVKQFVSQIDGRLWFDIPFGYTPFWNKVAIRNVLGVR